MSKHFTKAVWMMAGVIVAFLSVPNYCLAMERSWTNEETYHSMVILDEADVLDDEQEEALLQQMKSMTERTSVAFVSTDINSNTTEYYADKMYRQLLKEKSGVLFVVDMDNRMVYICTDGKMDDIVTKSYAYTITDNVYQYAQIGEYYECANIAFDQVNKLMNGERISQPMKYTCNFLLALLIALTINFMWVFLYAKRSNTSRRQILKDTVHYFDFGVPNVILEDKTLGSVKSHTGIRIKRSFRTYIRRFGSFGGYGGSGGRSGGGHRF